MRQAKALNTWIWKIELLIQKDEMLGTDPDIRESIYTAETWWCQNVWH